jgi:large subunit ribosomal protein L6
MSRLGKKPVPIPEKVKVAVSGATVSVEGPLGKLTQLLPRGIQAEVKDKEIVVSRKDDTKLQRSLHGTLRKVILRSRDKNSTCSSAIRIPWNTPFRPGLK